MAQLGGSDLETKSLMLPSKHGVRDKQHSHDNSYKNEKFVELLGKCDDKCNRAHLLDVERKGPCAKMNRNLVCVNLLTRNML